MTSRLAENIKALRKARNMTQEQLAEAMGVTVGAVYKWEAGLSTPELGLILALADLFETSTDALIGYQWQRTNAGAALERLQALTAEKDYAHALPEAEKLLRKYPNHFDIVYHSGLAYLAKGAILGEEAANQKATKILDHACELLSQNTDGSVTETSIRTQIARAHLYMGHVQTALEILKKHNALGVNNAFIGMILADFVHDVDEAGKYLGLATTSAITNLDYAMVGYTNVFFQKRDYAASLDCVRWLRNMLRSIQPEEEVTDMDKYDCVLLETMAEICCFLDDPETARGYLRAALEKARRYDRTPRAEIRGVRLYETAGIDYRPPHDYFGGTALDCLKTRMRHIERDTVPDDDEPPHLRQIWREEMKEVFPNETF